VNVEFELIEVLRVVETMAVGTRIRELERLEDTYGRGRWRKVKGIARVRLSGGVVRQAEVHWYEAHGIGRFEMKIKQVYQP
jgi:Cu/Ag efflux pump CusA